MGFIKIIGNLVKKPYYWSENKFIAESIIYIYKYKIKIKPKLKVVQKEPLLIL